MPPDELHLISHHLCPFVQRAIIVLQEKSVPFRKTYVDLAHKPAWFAELSPLGRTPVLKVGEAVLFESQVIVEYLDEVTPGSLHAHDALTKARERAWIEFGSETLLAIAGLYSASTAEDFADRQTNLAAKLKRVQQEVAGPYFAGESFRMIDAVWATVFRYFDVFEQIGCFVDFGALPRVSEWRATLAARPSVRAAVTPDYAERLYDFLQAKCSHLSSLMVGTR